MLRQKTFLQFAITPTLVLVCLLFAGGQPGQARNQWDINHGGTNPTPFAPGQDPRFAPGGVYGGYSGRVAASSANPWALVQGQIANRVNAGSVVTATMMDTITSRKSKPGDVFRLSLEDGLLNANTNTMVIPPKSVVTGVVTNSFPASAQRGQGQPGRLSISLQSLSCPDGRTVPISAQMDQNPNHLVTTKPKTKSLGYGISGYGQQVAGMFGSFLTGPGYLMAKRNRGNEFVLEKGEIVPLRLTRTLIMPEIPPPAQAPIRPGQGNATAPGQPVQWASKPQVPPAAANPNVLPGLVPGLVPGQGQSPGENQDPNAVFNMPLDNNAPPVQAPAQPNPGAQPQAVPGLVEEPF